ncbi:molybdate ABC transporter substrate-binding protein [Fulvivirgaceae bacterium BMA12]|uniref:Molybdate ABC transporter substrate-binding protein n=1 Tax=Agaribacillus aureus TaxID=3051825 RepID=A0ABT8L8A1_9BACT|nr:molybdate ABC transporter substrate-binding protein [Fulvivirgaceae bacterium BMA12]
MKINLPSLLFLSVLIFEGCGPDYPASLKIATAANVQYAMKALTADFAQRTGIRTEVIVGSSGKLTAQILQGAPYDIFISADMKYPAELFKNDKTLTEPVVYARGKLVLWTLDQDISLNLDSISSKKIAHLAIANPTTAPYGKAAVATLKYYAKYELVKPKIVSGESISQTNQFVLSGAAQLGFTAKSVVLAPALKDKGKWIEIDPLSYDPIQQGMVILKKQNPNAVEAKKFYNYVLSSQGRAILDAFGYETDTLK